MPMCSSNVVSQISLLHLKLILIFLPSLLPSSAAHESFVFGISVGPIGRSLLFPRRRRLIMQGQPAAAVAMLDNLGAITAQVCLCAASTRRHWHCAECAAVGQHFHTFKPAHMVVHLRSHKNGKKVLGKRRLEESGVGSGAKGQRGEAALADAALVPLDANGGQAASFGEEFQGADNSDSWGNWWAPGELSPVGEPWLPFTADEGGSLLDEVPNNRGLEAFGAPASPASTALISSPSSGAAPVLDVQPAPAMVVAQTVSPGEPLAQRSVRVQTVKRGGGDGIGWPVFDWLVDGVAWKPPAAVSCDTTDGLRPCNWQRNGTYPVTLVTFKGPTNLSVQRYRCSVHNGKASASDDRFRQEVLAMAMATWHCPLNG